MEVLDVYVKEKNCDTCLFRKDVPNFICGDNIAERVGTNTSYCGLKYHATHFNNCPLKTLEQHDTEIRADERKKVIEELGSWHYKKLLEVREKEKIENKNKGNEDEMARLYALFLGRYNILGDLQQKLTEMKGEN
jgi:hypothetical protein